MENVTVVPLTVKEPLSLKTLNSEDLRIIQQAMTMDISEIIEWDQTESSKNYELKFHSVPYSNKDE